MEKEENKKKKSKIKQKKFSKKAIELEDVETLDGTIEENTESKRKEKNTLQNVLLVFSIVLLIGSCGLFFYLFNKQKNLNDDVDALQKNIVTVKEKINGNEKEKAEKENEYEKLKDELKEKVEELDIWKDLEEKLKQALS